MTSNKLTEGERGRERREGGEREEEKMGEELSTSSTILEEIFVG